MIKKYFILLAFIIPMSASYAALIDIKNNCDAPLEFFNKRNERVIPHWPATIPAKTTFRHQKIAYVPYKKDESLEAYLYVALKGGDREHPNHIGFNFVKNTRFFHTHNDLIFYEYSRYSVPQTVEPGRVNPKSLIFCP